VGKKKNPWGTSKEKGQSRTTFRAGGKGGIRKWFSAGVTGKTEGEQNKERGTSRKGKRGPFSNNNQGEREGVMKGWWMGEQRGGGTTGSEGKTFIEEPEKKKKGGALIFVAEKGGELCKKVTRREEGKKSREKWRGGRKRKKLVTPEGGGQFVLKGGLREGVEKGKGG